MSHNIWMMIPFFACLIVLQVMAHFYRSEREKAWRYRRLLEEAEYWVNRFVDDKSKDLSKRIKEELDK